MKKLAYFLFGTSLSLYGCVGSSVGSNPNQNGTNAASKSSLAKAPSNTMPQIRDKEAKLSAPYLWSLGNFIFDQIPGSNLARSIFTSFGIDLAGINNRYEAVHRELEIVKKQIKTISAGLSDFEETFARNNYFSGGNTLADIFSQININYTNIYKLFSSETGHSFSTVDNYDDLKLTASQTHYDSVIRQIFNYDNIADLEIISNQLSDTKTPVLAKQQIQADQYFLSSYFKSLYYYLQTNAKITPWDKAISSYTDYKDLDINGIEQKAGYFALINYTTVEILERLQEIASIFEYSAYVRFIKHNNLIAIPSYIKIDSKASDQTNYTNAVKQIQEEFIKKTQKVMSIAEEAKNLYQLPQVGSGEKGSLPENCLQPNDIPQLFSLEEIKKDWLYWSGYGGKRTGKLLTMCKDKSGKYVSTYPIFLGVPGNEDKNENLFCPYLFYKDEYLFCHSGPSFPNTIIREHLQPSIRYEEFVKNIHIDSASDKDGHFYKFTQDDLDDTLHSIKNFNSDAATKGELKSHWIEIDTPYKKLNGTFLTFELPETIPLVINFHDAKTGKHHYCTTTLNYDVSRYKKLPSLTAVDISAKSIRCGNDGQFKLMPNPNHSNTFNVTPW